MPFANVRGISLVVIGLVLLGLQPLARADIIYNVTGLGSNDFIPFENDGTPNRPPGDHLGNQITFGGSNRELFHVQVVIASIGPKEVDTYTLDLYRNDGAIDPHSGLQMPGTLIGEFKTDALNQPLPGNGGYGVDWFFNPILVPDTLTAVISSTYSTTTPGQFMGPFAAVLPPLQGSAINTVWYGDGTAGNWQANSTWAINDGGVTNLFDMRFEAVPEPSSIHLALISAGLLVAAGNWRRSPMRVVPG